MRNAIVAVLLLAASAGARAQDQGSAPAQDPSASSGPVSGGLPTEIVIKSNGAKVTDKKPPLNINVDPFETIRPDLKPDESLLLAVSPLTVSWRRTHPEFLLDERVIQPWRTTFSAKPGILFRVRQQMSDALGELPPEKELRRWSWSLAIADEEGRVFHHYEGQGEPPKTLVWSGQNDQGEWIRAGRSYSPVYTFTSPDGSPRTRVGAPLDFKGIVHQEDTGLHISLDSSVLFGPARTGTSLQDPAGAGLLRGAADLIKRRYSGIPIAVRVYANTQELGQTQAQAVQDFLLAQLMLPVRQISTDAARAPFSDQRVEVVLLNR
ncbi:MAG: hypothetical protein KGM24_15220 [Elusimicrobia bacterium]|nr:hypothetical protein [Elusimicrobiota bacterium]